MAQKTEKEEPETLPICTPPLTILAPRSPSDHKITRSPKKNPDLPFSGSKRPREASRCSGSGCRKLIGFMGFRCRCGDVFCGEHRYSDRHDCSYDYKAAGREAISRENPVVRAAKLVKV